MNENIEKLLEVCQFIGRNDIASDLKNIKNKLENKNKSITIPLVGEFSSGKTSLINSLLNDNNLETASKATTATVFEIYFGAKQSAVKIFSEDGEEKSVEENADIRNECLNNSEIVRVFDTSTKVPSSTVLVDTPGLSSSDPRHRLALTSYLPFSDAIFLVTDINQQLTKSLLDFIETANISEKPIYLIITKSDTKTQNEIDGARNYAKEYIESNNLKIEDIIVISAKDNNMAEFFNLLDKIQEQKNDIVNKALEFRIKSISQDVSNYINDLIKNTDSGENLEKQIDQSENDLERVEKNIDKLIRDAEANFEEQGDTVRTRFVKTVSERLERIVKEQGRDIDNEIYEAVNNAAKQNIDLYKKDIQYTLTNLARKRMVGIEAVPLQFLETLDISTMSLPEFSYNMNLASMGHKHDKAIGYGVLAAAAAATIYFGGPAILAASGTAGSAVEVAMGAGEVAADVAILSRVNKIANTGKKIYKTYEGVNEQMQKFTPQQRGMIETSVGWATDKFVGKPQRQKAIRNYVEDTLKPEFDAHMRSVRGDLVNTIGIMLHEEAREVTEQMKKSLIELKEEEKNSKISYQNKIKQLKEYRTILQNNA